MKTTFDDNAFRGALYALYLTWSERRGERAVLRFELDGNLKPSTVAKVFAEQHDTLDLATIDRLLDGLSDPRFGILTAAEREQWAEELHVARLVEMEKNHFVKLVNPKIGTLPDDYMDTLWAWARERYRRFQEQGLWAIEGAALALLARRMWGEAAVIEEAFLDNRNLWGWWEAGVRRLSGPDVRDGRLRMHVPGTVSPWGFPRMQDFIVSATLEATGEALDREREVIFGLMIFDRGASREYKHRDGFGSYRSPYPNAQQVIRIAPSSQRCWVEHYGYDEAGWGGEYPLRQAFQAQAVDCPPIAAAGPNTLAIRREGSVTAVFVNGIEVGNLYHDLPKERHIGVLFDSPLSPRYEVIVRRVNVVKLPSQEGDDLRARSLS